jgi:pimeloyl-ACP methyl ester carboxylesterase
MKKLIFVSFIILCSFSIVAFGESRTCPPSWQSRLNDNDCVLSPMVVQTTSIVTGASSSLNVLIRNGYLPENSKVPFKGNIIYYEGLGDSMVNHLPLFQKLTEVGYRVIAFDYMGQGGSTGSMNDTRIIEIGKIGDQIWLQNARDLVHFPSKIIIGWSTGGLAAYVQGADDVDVKALVLIAPGIAPNVLVGEQHPFKGELDDITLSSLTTARYASSDENPHLDPIKPSSPLSVPLFAIDLFRSAQVLGRMPVRKNLWGFVLLSGKNDTYVDANATRKIVQKQAPQFLIKQYPGSLHEIDNESEPNGSLSRQDILNFIESIPLDNTP